MKLFTANYALTNSNFVIQNLNGKKVHNKHLPSILIIKNILQRGKPTIMSKYLQSKIGNIHKYNNYNNYYALIDKYPPVWHHTIKGDDNGNYNPAKNFLGNFIIFY